MNRGPGEKGNRKDQRRMMEETPVGKLLWKMSGPSVIGVMAYNLYHVFDTVFIAQGAGTNAVGGVAVSFPLFIFLSAVSSTLGSGAASVISRALGEGDREKAAQTAANTFLAFYSAAGLITVLGLLFLDELLLLMGVTEALFPYAKTYTQIILLGAVTSTGFSNLIRAEGNSRYAMYIWVIPMCTNIVLDCILIFLLDMGVLGAAAGTVAAQTVSMGMSIYYFYLSGKSVLSIKLRHFMPQFRLLREVIGIGLPSFLQLSGQTISLIIVNQFLRKYGGDLAISSYGIVNKIVVFFLFPIQGLCQGLQPVIGYNKGIGNKERTKKALRIASCAAGVYGGTGYLLSLVLAEKLVQLFTSDMPAAEMGSHILVIVNASLLFHGIQNIQGTYFQAAGRKAISLLIVLCGQLFCFIPSILILGSAYGLEGIWYSFPVSAAAALVITSMITAVQIRREDDSFSCFHLHE